MSSTPLIACSSGEATVSAMTCGFAPGYRARTTTVGGTTSGYSLIGRSFREIAPAMKMIADKTPAKIGRLTKKLEKFTGNPFERLANVQSHGVTTGVDLREHALAAVHRHLGGRNGDAGAHSLQAVDDHDVVRLQAARHDAQAVDLPPGFDRAVLNDVLVVDHEHELASEIRADGAVVHERGAELLRAHEPDSR